MTTMLEKAARALALERGWDEGYNDPDFSEQYHRDNGPSAYTFDVRAALLAIREPDDVGVMEAGYEANYRNNVRDTFTAMIDAILAGETET